jgi:hypothetical protein
MAVKMLWGKGVSQENPQNQGTLRKGEVPCILPSMACWKIESVLNSFYSHYGNTLLDILRTVFKNKKQPNH